MTTQAKKGFGTTLSVGGTPVGEVLRVTSPNRTRGSIDTTNLSSSDDYREFIPGIKDGGESTFICNLYPGDTGQAALETAFEDGTTDTYVITFPSGIGAAITFSGFLTAAPFSEAVPDDSAIQITFTVKVTGKPTFGTTASTGASIIAAANVTIAPAFATGTYFYQGELQNVNETFTVTVTAASHTIKLYVDDVFTENLSSGSASSAISIAAGAVKLITVIVWEAAMTAKTYKLMVERASS